MKLQPNRSRMGMLKKVTLSLMCFSTISACANDIPDGGDIKKALQIAFQSCERTRIGTVKKINGMEGDKKNQYDVSFEFELDLSPSKEAMERLEKYAGYRAAKAKNQAEFDEGMKVVNQIKADSKAFTQQAYDEEYARMMAANGGQVEELARFSAQTAASHAVDGYFQKLYDEGKITKRSAGEMQHALRQIQNQKDAEFYRKEHAAMLYLAEFHSGFCRNDQVSLVAGAFREVVKDARVRNYETEYVQGGKVTITATSTLTKTENGWVF